MKEWFNRHVKPLWDPTSRFLRMVERAKFSKIMPRQRYAEFQKFIARAAVTPGAEHVAIRFSVASEGEEAYGWLSYEIVQGDLDSATLRLDGMYLPGGPENRFGTPGELENAPVFDIGPIQ